MLGSDSYFTSNCSIVFHKKPIASEVVQVGQIAELANGISKKAILMRNNLMVAYAVIWLMCFSACAFANGIVSRREVLSALPPEVQWIAREKIRAGWSPPIWLLPLVKAHGLNAIFPRLELPPTGHHDYEKCKRQFRKMSRECKRLGLHMFHVLNAGDRWFNRSYGYKDNPRRLNGSRNAPRDGMPPCPLD